MLRAAKNIIVVAGAGLSSASGLSTKSALNVAHPKCRHPDLSRGRRNVEVPKINVSCDPRGVRRESKSRVAVLSLPPGSVSAFSRIPTTMNSVQSFTRPTKRGTHRPCKADDSELFSADRASGSILSPDHPKCRRTLYTSNAGCRRGTATRLVFTIPPGPPRPLMPD